MKTLWKEHRALLLAATAAVLLLAGFGVYKLFAERPGDVTNEDAVFVQEDVEEPTFGNWPTYGLTNERTRHLEADLQPPFKIRWPFKGRTLLEFSPVLLNRTLYLTNKNGTLFAINADKGKKRWERKIGELIAASPAVGEERIVAPTLEPGSVVALDKFGKVRWKRDLPGRSESSPAIADGKVIVGCECGVLYAFDVKTGKPVWERDLGGQIKAAPAIDQGIIYVGDYGGQLSAVRLQDGSVKWQTGTSGGAFGRTGRIYATAAVAFGRVYVGSLDGRMYSFEKETGKLAWSKSTGGYVYGAAIAADTSKTRPTVYFGSYDGNFYALDARSGSTRWQRDIGTHISGAPTLVGDTVYVGELKTTRTFALSAKDGDVVWTFKDGAYNPVISDGTFIYLTGVKWLYALRPLTQQEKKRRAQGAGGQAQQG